jgi:hypothetical protein
MNYFFLAAGGISAFALIWHIMIGRTRPLFPPGDAENRLLQLDAYYGRHATTVLLAVMALSFAQASRRAALANDVALLVTVLSLTLAGLRLALAIRVRAPRLDVAEWALPALAGLLGFVGLQFRF